MIYHAFIHLGATLVAVGLYKAWEPLCWVFLGAYLLVLGGWHWLKDKW